MRARTSIPFLALAVLALTAVACTCGDECQLAEQNRELVEKALEVINDGELDRLGEFYAEDYLRHSQSSPVPEMTTLEQLKQFLIEDRSVFPDGHGVADVVVAEGNMVAMYGRWIGTQEGPMGPFPPTGKQMSLEFSGIHRIENGKIVETWVTWDNMAVLTQLGHMQPSVAPPAEKPEALD
jgi:steroid delta-isomerase-like uncharacterized protein